MCRLQAAISAIPKIVCETIHALELHDETPSWKIMDNKGRVTVVLHWDQRPGGAGTGRPAAALADQAGPKFSPSKKSPQPDLAQQHRPSLVIQTSLDKLQGKKETVINDVYAAAAQAQAR